MKLACLRTGDMSLISFICNFKKMCVSVQEEWKKRQSHIQNREKGPKW